MSRGVIKIDGVDVDGVTLRRLRSSVTVIPQVTRGQTNQHLYVYIYIYKYNDKCMIIGVYILYHIVVYGWLQGGEGLVYHRNIYLSC